MCGETLPTPTRKRGANPTTAITALVVVTGGAVDDVDVEDVAGVAVDTPFRLVLDPKRFLIKMSMLWNKKTRQIVNYLSTDFLS